MSGGPVERVEEAADLAEQVGEAGSSRMASGSAQR